MGSKDVSGAVGTLAVLSAYGGLPNRDKKCSSCFGSGKQWQGKGKGKRQVICGACEGRGRV